jgi:hypothetical protein
MNAGALLATIGQWGDEDEGRCRVCGCTEQLSCEGGCTWVADPEGMGDICSRCVPGYGGSD